MLFLRQGVKRVLLTFAGFLALIGLFHLSVVNICGPNAEDVAVMKPQAEVIAKYVLEDGIPESLAQIPHLTYKLEGCKKKVTYKKQTVPVVAVEKKEEADFAIIEEECVFMNQNKKYDVSIFFTDDYKDTIGSGKLSMRNWQSETAIRYMFDGIEGNRFIIGNKPHFYSFKTSGICNPMRQ